MSTAAAANVRAPDIAGEVVAYRAWHVQTRERGRQRARLVSVNQGTPWPAREWLVAACALGCEQPPGEACACGIYAARDRRHMDNLNIRGIHDSHGARIIFGEVALAGGVIEGDLGWRAERARPLRLWVPHIEWQFGVALRDAYGVEIQLFNPFEDDDEWT